MVCYYCCGHYYGSVFFKSKWVEPRNCTTLCINYNRASVIWIFMQEAMDTEGCCTKKCARFTLHFISHVTLFTCFVFSVTIVIIYSRAASHVFCPSEGSGNSHVEIIWCSACKLNTPACVSIWILSLMLIGAITFWGLYLIYRYSTPNWLCCCKSKWVNINFVWFCF
jgi:hypothetical protein